MHSELELITGRVDLHRGVLHGESAEVRLTARECSLLGYLAARPGVVVSRNELLREVFGVAERVKSRSVDTTMARLRQKVERDPASPAHLRTVVGRGVQFVPKVTKVDENALSIGRWRFDPAAGTLLGEDGTSVALTAQQAVLLARLGEARGAVVSDTDLLRSTHGDGGSRRALTAAIYRLRALVEADPGSPVHVLTVPGKGYRLVAHSPMAAPTPEGPPLFGREGLIAELQGRLTRGSVVLVGPSGIGKTRLALEAADRMPDEIEVVWVGLEAVTDAPGAREAMGMALGVSPSVDALRERLRAFTGLLVLDGVIEAHDVDAWQTSGTVLLTALRPLDRPGMQRVDVPPLEPDAAAALFAHAAGHHAPEPIEGPPLEIVLAARRARHTPAAAIDPGLEATWDALSDRDRSVWAQATVFVGGFDLDAAEAVIATPGWVVDALDGLVDARVLTMTRVGQTIRYGLHARLRELGASRLGEDDRIAAEGRLVEWARRLARRHEVWVGTGAHEVDLPNLRKARRLAPLDPDITRMLVWPHQQLFDGDAALALCEPILAANPDPGLLIEKAGVHIGRLELDAASAALDAIPLDSGPTIRAGVAWLRAEIVQHEDGHRAALGPIDAGLAVEDADPLLRQTLLLMRADSLVLLGDIDEAEALALEALTLPGNPAQAYLRLADCAERRGELDAAIEHLQTLLRQNTDRAVRENTRRMLGQVLWRAGRDAEAERTLLQALDRERGLGQAYGLGGAIAALIRFRVHQGDFGALPPLVEEALAAVGDTPTHPFGWFHAWGAVAAVAAGRDPLPHARRFVEWNNPEQVAQGFFAVLRPLWDATAPPSDGDGAIDSLLARICVEKLTATS